MIKETSGFNGADLEAIAKDTIEMAVIDGKDMITTEDLLKSAKDTKSISSTLKEKIKEIKSAIVAIEDVKVVGQMMSGELSFKEGIEKIEQTTVATAAGLVSMGKGTSIGAAGTIFGPPGTAIGGFVGGTIGYMAGSKVGETVVKGIQKIRDVAGNR